MEEGEREERNCETEERKGVKGEGERGEKLIEREGDKGER